MFGNYETYEFTTVYGSTSTIRIPKDASAWQMFDDMQGAGLAAYRMKRALIKAFEKFIEVAKATNGDLQKAVIEADGLHRKTRWDDANSKFGSSDGEPRRVAQRKIADFARAWSGNEYAEFYDCF